MYYLLSILDHDGIVKVRSPSPATVSTPQKKPDNKRAASPTYWKKLNCICNLINVLTFSHLIPGPEPAEDVPIFSSEEVWHPEVLQGGPGVIQERPRPFRGYNGVGVCLV